MCQKRIFPCASWLTMIALIVTACGIVGGNEPPLEPAYSTPGAPANAYPAPNPLNTPPAGAPSTVEELLGGPVTESPPTPFPTLTPRPTPTPRPGPTTVPFPTRQIATDPSGSLLYLSCEGSLNVISLDVQGRKINEAALYLSPEEMARKFIGPASPDGIFVVLMESREPGGLPFILEVETGKTWPLFKSSFAPEQFAGQSYEWHPDSIHILHWAFATDELLLVNALTGELTTLALTNGPLQGATISPDGQKVVYLNRTGQDRFIEQVSPGGQDTDMLFDARDIAYLFEFSPDGRYLLYTDGKLGLLELDGYNQRELSGPFLFGYGFRAYWSPDSQWVAYTGLDPDQTFGCARPDPDWSTCLFAGSAIYVENVYSGEVRRLASGIWPVWSPDGSMVAFLATQNGEVGIYRVKVDGSDLQQFADDAQLNQFAWLFRKRG